MITIAHCATWAAALLLGLASIIATSGAAMAQTKPPLHITLTSKGYEPALVHVVAGSRIKILVNNKTALPAEFESAAMAVEQMIPGRTQLPVYIRPLPPGTYIFLNDFAQHVSGKIIVK